MESIKVKVIIVISGKRKSGKDFLANNIINTLGLDKCTIIRLSSPIKQHFCVKYNMELTEMLSSSSYKETIRKEMIAWGEEQRKMDPGVFCRMITEEALLSQNKVWIVSDARRLSDVEYFRSYASENNVKCYCVRVFANEETRTQRNWKFTSGVDNAESECGLDTYKQWDFVYRNSMNDNFMRDIKTLCDFISEKIS